jgi:hypothetical protein
MRSGGFSLTVRGSGFTEASKVRWNGTDRITTFVSSSELTGTVLDADVATPGYVEISVYTPPPGGGSSEAIPFAVRIPLKGPVLEADASHTCALTESGQAYCWGMNDEGQLGDGSATHAVEPIEVTGDLALV